MNWLPKQRVVAPIDFSQASHEAVDEALRLVADPAAVRVVHVLQDVSANEPGVVWGVVDRESRTRHVTDAFNEEFADAKYDGIDFRVVFGDPGHEITDYAETCGADLIVLSSHGRTGLKRFMIGSVAERVVRLARCPVLVLRS